MIFKNPHAIYIHCDGAMNYDKQNSGGTGYLIKFPESIDIDNYEESYGIYVNANIEMLEIQGLIKAFEGMIMLYKVYGRELNPATEIIFITDRFSLQDSGNITNPYLIREWRKNNWHSREGKPIKNHVLIDKLDKLRKKLSDLSFKKVSIHYWPRKKNKEADKLAKKGKKEGLIDKSIGRKYQKIGKRKYNGAAINYKLLEEDKLYHIHVYNKVVVQDEWEISVELESEWKHGKTFKIYADNELSGLLKRRNMFEVRIKKVYRSFVRIHPEIKNLKE